MGSFESIDNHQLIFNGLEHIEFELARKSTSYFRVARESHQILYRSLVEALKGTANLAVTGRPNGRREHRYQFSNSPIKEIHKESVPGCRFAWRFSSPVIVGNFFHSDGDEIRTTPDDFLIPFYDALAMVQAECFVHQYIHSLEIKLSDEEMKLMEWLHEDVRNQYEHFVPKGYSAPFKDLLLASKVAVEKARACLFDSNNVLYFEHSVSKESMRSTIEKAVTLIDSHRKDQANR